jgi:signal transduction histidine kinase
MASHSHRRQVLLFLVAVLLPCAALLALGLRLVVQERELVQARLEEEQRQLVREVRQNLSTRLDRMALRQVTALSSDPEVLRARAYDDSIVVLVARVSNGQLLLPWEQDPRPEESRALLGGGPFGERIREGERAEFAASDPETARQQYRLALDAAGHPVQEAYARLCLARASAKCGRQADARAGYEVLAQASPETVDENGIPMALYAARQLLRAGTDGAEVSAAVGRTLTTSRWLPPPALYLLRDVADTLVRRSETLSPREEVHRLAMAISHEVSHTEQAMALKRDFPRLGIPFPDTAETSPENTWVSYGVPVWLVGAAPVGGYDGGVVVAVRAEPFLSTAGAELNGSANAVGDVFLTTEHHPEAEPLGSSLPGVFVRFHPAEGEPYLRAGSVQWWFYAAGLLLIFGVTLFGAYLLWRDVRREVELADTRSRFVAAVSHELKTPLTAIRMFAETLYEGGSPDDQTRSEYLETIVEESERLTRLLNNVLDFSKIEGGKKTYRMRAQSLEEIVRFSARAMRYPLEQGRFALHLDIQDDLPPARVDRDGIEQAILNLLANAMKYSGESRDIELRLRCQDGEAVIEVSDRGVGIEPSEVPRIFDRFYRVSTPENDHVPGAGLGLTLVQHIAEAHGGRIVVTSTPGEGSTFSLFLPLGGADL